MLREINFLSNKFADGVNSIETSYLKVRSIAV